MEADHPLARLARRGSVALAATVATALACTPLTPPPGRGVRYGYVRPRPLCGLEARIRAIAVPPAAAVVEVEARFTVLEDGRVDAFRIAPGWPADTQQRIREAVESCGWAPGRDPAGVPMRVTAVMPLRIVGAGRHVSSSPPVLSGPEDIQGG